MNSKKIKFLVIGCGMIGRKHIEMINANQNCEVLAVIDKKDKKNINIDLSGIKYFQSLSEFFHSNIKVDIANIATPNGLHVEHALKCLDNNLHVVIEKPLALSKHDSEKIIHKSLELKKNVFVVMQNRYSPPIKWAKKILEDNLLGDLYIVQINCFWNRDDRYYKNHEWHGKKDLDGGTLFTQFSHFIDIVYFLFGDINNISSKFFNYNHQNTIEFEDSGVVIFNLNRGGNVTMNYTTSVWDKNLESSMTVIGENGSFKIGGQYMDIVEYCHIKDYNFEKLPETNPPNKYGDYVGSAQNHQYVIQNVVDVLNKSKTIKTNALEGLKVTEIIEKIYNKAE